jgi:SPP1 gp7 family putative phage head morphogenesis protein
MTSQEIEQLLRMIYSGVYTPTNLPLPLYNFLTSKLERGLFQGFGGKLDDFVLRSPNWRMLSDLRLNIYEFSAAKTFQEVLDIQSAIVDPDGFIRPFAEFRETADQMWDMYNVTHLETEYNTAINQSLSAREWSDLEESGAKKLMYQTQNDPNVREEHAALDGLVYPINDPFWNTYMPLNGWNCRCFVVEAFDEPVSPKLTRAERAEINTQVPPLFRVNPGKDRLIYDKEKHPYFDVPRQFEYLKDVNFNLPLPQ